MKKIILFFLLAQIYIFFSNFPIFLLSKKNTPSSFYTLTDTDRFGDYNGYLAAITQGQNHYTYYHNPYSTEKAYPNFYYWIYIFAGWITSIFRIWPPYVYHALKIASSEVFCFCLFLFAKVIFKKKYILPAIAALSTTVFPQFIFDLLKIPITTNWWYLQDAFPRLSQAPHHTIGESLLLISLCLLFWRIIHKTFKYIHIEAICIFVAGTIFPPVIFPYIFPSFYISILDLKNSDKKSFFIRFLPIFSSIIVGILNIIQLNTGFHRQVWSIWEVERWNNNEPLFNTIFLLSLGLSTLIVFIQIISLIIRKIKIDLTAQVIVIWSITSLFLLPLATYIGISKIRLYAVLPQIAFTILISYIFYKFFSKKVYYISIITIILFSFTTSLSLFIDHTNLIKKTPTYSNVFYPLETWDSISYINKEFDSGTVILSNEQIGNIIPAYAPVISYFGHINLTLNFKEKQNNVWKFYTSQMTNEEAKDFLDRNNISYIFWGQDEKSLGEQNLEYPFIKPIYNSNNIVIYKTLEI